MWNRRISTTRHLIEGKVSILRYRYTGGQNLSIGKKVSRNSFPALGKGAVGTSLPDKAGASLVLAKGVCFERCNSKELQDVI
jgi:hypothetical protein